MRLDGLRNGRGEEAEVTQRFHDHPELMVGGCGWAAARILTTS
jgi:hypothetical protein